MANQLDSLRAWLPNAGARLSSAVPAQTISIASGKGGVGKSHITLSLALALSQQGKRVLLLDGDMGLANLHILAGVHPKADLGDVMAGRCTVADALIPVAQGVDLLPSASGVAGLSSLPVEKMNQLVDSLSKIQDDYTHVLVDIGAGIGETSLQLAVASDRVILVTTPEATAQADAYAFVKVSRARRADLPFSLVINLCDAPEQGPESAMRLASVARRFLGIELPYWGGIPRQRGLDQYLRQRVPAFLADPQGPFSRAIVELARRIPDGQTGSSPGFFARLKESA
ncbi:MAG: flagellar biosynthesis switch protein [Fibrobacterota bacterium]